MRSSSSGLDAAVVIFVGTIRVVGDVFEVINKINICTSNSVQYIQSEPRKQLFVLYCILK
jgi:hypothetical protein